MTGKQQAYRQYLESDHWKSLREEALRRDGFVCVVCGKDDRLQVHHTAYRTPWETGVIEDVKTLCRVCHSIEHGFRLPPDSEFDVLRKSIWRKMMTIEEGQRFDWSGDFSRMAKIAKGSEEERWVEDLLRKAAECRICATNGMWNKWLKSDSRMTHRLFGWARKRREELKNKKDSDYVLLRENIQFNVQGVPLREGLGTVAGDELCGFKRHS